MAIDPAFALHRFGLGAKPGQLRRMPSNMAGLLKEALREETAPLDANKLRSTSANLLAFARFREERQKPAADKQDKDATGAEMERRKPPQRTIYLAEIEARLARFRKTETGVLERLTLFWANHFAISARRGQVQIMAGSYEREAIRPHITGRFVDLLRAVISHPAMLVYLDNNRSIGPNSKRGQQKGRGLNENLARELLELHTLGVDSGYRQEDVAETAKILTGWSYRGRNAKRGPFEFGFLRSLHEPGSKTVLGKTYPEAGKNEGLALIEDLARHPATARHIATKLARHFVADDPPAELTEALEQGFLRGDGDLLQVYDILLDHPLSWSPAPGKLRTPLEWLAAAVRAFEVDMPAPIAHRSLRVMGQQFWSPPSPKGYEDNAKAWLGGAMIKARLDLATAFVERFTPSGDPLNVAAEALGDRLTEETGLAMRRAASRQQAFQIMLLSPEMMRR